MKLKNLEKYFFNRAWYKMLWFWHQNKEKVDKLLNYLLKDCITDEKRDLWKHLTDFMWNNKNEEMNKIKAKCHVFTIQQAIDQVKEQIGELEKIDKKQKIGIVRVMLKAYKEQIRKLNEYTYYDYEDYEPFVHREEIDCQGYTYLDFESVKEMDVMINVWQALIEEKY